MEKKDISIDRQHVIRSMILSPESLSKTLLRTTEYFETRQLRTYQVTERLNYPIFRTLRNRVEGGFRNFILNIKLPGLFIVDRSNTLNDSSVSHFASKSLHYR